MKKNVVLASILVMFLQGCVSKKKFNEQVKLLDAETKAHSFTQMGLDRCKLENEGIIIARDPLGLNRTV
jgi:hypothetical protein